MRSDPWLPRQLMSRMSIGQQQQKLNKDTFLSSLTIHQYLFSFAFFRTYFVTLTESPYLSLFHTLNQIRTWGLFSSKIWLYFCHLPTQRQGQVSCKTSKIHLHIVHNTWDIKLWSLPSSSPPVFPTSRVYTDVGKRSQIFSVWHDL